MQNAKDSFYMALRTRLTSINPERTVLLRGAVRPGIVVEEAEAPFSQIPNDVFVLRWLGFGAMRDSLSNLRDAEFWRPGPGPGAEPDGRRTDGDASTVPHAETQLHGNAASGDADADFLG